MRRESWTTKLLLKKIEWNSFRRIGSRSGSESSGRRRKKKRNECVFPVPVTWKLCYFFQVFLSMWYTDNPLNPLVVQSVLSRPTETVVKFWNFKNVSRKNRIIPALFEYIIGLFNHIFVTSFFSSHALRKESRLIEQRCWMSKQTMRNGGMPRRRRRRTRMRDSQVWRHEVFDCFRLEKRQGK